jgi:hypothetical protein
VDERQENKLHWSYGIQRVYILLGMSYLLIYKVSTNDYKLMHCVVINSTSIVLTEH